MPESQGEMDQLIELLAGVAARLQAVMLTAPEPADGDSIGSQLALKRVLQSRFPGLDVAIVNADDVPQRYAGLPGADQVEAPEQRAGTVFGMAIVLDGGYDRIGAAQPLFDSAGSSVLFDHHVLGDDHDYDLRVVDPDAAATAEIVDRLRRHPAVDVPLDAEMAEALYTALIFDTGFFKHSSTTPATLRLAADLFSTGIDFTRIAEETMLLRRPAGVALLGRVLGRVTSAAGGRIVHTAVLLDDLEATGAEPDDREGLIDNVFLVEGCEIGVLFSEVGGASPVVKCSFRSRRDVDVAAVARRLTVRGGGHRQAAGCTLEGDLETWRPRVLRALEDAILATSGVN